MKYVFTLLISFNSITAYSQDQISGVILDKNSGNPIANAHISIFDKGTVSGPEGKFTLQNVKDDSIQIKISHVGYEEKKVTLAVNVEIKTIELIPKVIELREVVVNSSKKTTIKLGAIAKKPVIVYFGHVKGDIKLLKIKNENPAAGHYLKSLNYYFVQSKKTLGKGYNGAGFLIKIYDYDETTDLPGEELTKNPIKVTSKGRNKWMSVDISKFKIPLPATSFFIGVEFTEERGFETQFGRTQIEPCFGGTSEFGQDELCYSLRQNKWEKSSQNIMINVEAGEIIEK